MVWHPAAPQPLYGLLAFCPIPPAVRDPSARSHGIQIREQYVHATEGGLTSVVYDVVEYDWAYREPATGEVETISEWPAWILWLNQRPM